MSNADQVQLVIAEQTDYDTIGTTTGTDLRFTSEDLKQDTETVMSAEIRNDRQVSDILRTSVQASGTINGELSYGTYDDLFKNAMLSAGWSTQATPLSDTTFSWAAASNGSQVITDSGSGFGDFTVGEWVLVQSSEAANTGVFRIEAVSAGTLTVYNPAGIVESSGIQSVIAELASITNGTTQSYFAAERVYGDLAGVNQYALFTGLQADTLALNFAANAIPTVAFGMVGKSETSPGSVTFSTVTAANTEGVMNATDDVFDVWVRADDSSGTHTNQGVCVLDAAINVANNLRARPCIGVLGPDSWGAGKFAVTGTLRMYFETKAAFDEYLNFTTSRLAITLSKGGDYYVFDLPSIKFTSGTRVAGGENTDIIMDLGFSAFEDATYGYTMKIHRHTSL